ncbi:MAG: bis-aminopropyl spermidine synthase family protein [Candidatus Caldatribacteriaceae bacterium]
MNRYETQILRSLKEGPKSFWRLLDEQDEHISGFVERLKTLWKENLVVYKDGKFMLTEEGREKSSMIPPYRRTTCPQCRGGYNPSIFEEAFSWYAELVENRPLPNLDFDQGFMTKEDIFARVSFLYERGDLEGQKILIVGDDDLFSLALATTGLPKSITVLEIDPRLVEFIRKRSQENHFPIEVHQYNVADPYPLSEHYFQVFLTDPVESERGLIATLSRGAQALEKWGALYFGLTTVESSWRKWYNIEKALLDMNFVITDIVRRFSSYPDSYNHFDENFYDRTMMRRLLEVELPLPADADWFRSSFIRCEAIEEPKPIVVGGVPFDRSFYLDDETMATPGY